MVSKPFFVPIASGKGGVGKSILAANLAVALANSGHSVIAIDLDLGGSNLYSYLGLENIYAGIGDYLISKKGKLKDYLVQAGMPNLKYLAADHRVPFLANIGYAQKVKLINEIKNLQADYIVMDLGAGTTFNTLDYFDFSTNGLVVTTFEKPAILNTLSFIKNFIHRVALKEIKQNSTINADINRAYKNLTGDDFLTIKDIISIAEKVDTALASKIVALTRSYQPRIIFNRGNHPDQLEVCNSLQSSIQKYLSIDLCFFGFLFEEDPAKLSSLQSYSLLRRYPESVLSKGINDISKRIVKFNNRIIANSSGMLINDTREKFEMWNSQQE
ncbi:MAG TPA: P-loop NTPase [Bacteroidales bacterium]|nr:P-loop NTPase [Bacteroidales bacterium]